jgi:hypothetical protein
LDALVVGFGLGFLVLGFGGALAYGAVRSTD